VKRRDLERHPRDDVTVGFVAASHPILQLVSDVLTYLGDNLFVPIVVVVIGGLILAWFLRSRGTAPAPEVARSGPDVAREVTENDARAQEIQIDLQRWVADREQQLRSEIRCLINQAGRGVVSRMPVPLGTEPPGAGSQLYAGALKNEQQAGMQEALHQYRDEASQKVRDFSGLARSEGPAHAEYRRIQDLDGPVLRLDREGRETLGLWRQRESPIPNDPDPVRVDNDRTANQPEIAPLDTEAGLSWETARHGAAVRPWSQDAGQ
jgi:hypothetical protein